MSAGCKRRRSLQLGGGMGIRKDQGHQFSLGHYLKRRNGVALSASGSLGNMMQRSFGAASFAGFWRYRNPIFSYYLDKHVYGPTSRFAPRWLALLVTFLICGSLHYIVTLVYRGSTQFLFTLWFLFFALGVILSEGMGMNMARRPFWFRAAMHLTYLLVCLVLAISAQELFVG